MRAVLPSVFAKSVGGAGSRFRQADLFREVFLEMPNGFFEVTEPPLAVSIGAHAALGSGANLYVLHVEGDPRLDLETNSFTRDPHFWLQSRLLEGNLIKLYRFPSDLDALATEAGLSLPLPNIDGDNDPGAKPVLSQAQVARVQAIYADDIALYESIAEAGQEFDPAAPPVPEPVPSPITAWQAKAGLAMTPYAEGGTLLDAAEAALAAMPDGAEKIVVLSAWNNNANLERNSPTILSFGAALGMTSDDLDNLFRLGASLAV